ncbi:MAG: hypothetical protein ABDH37_07425 [Candidatus Hydrothermales bacterium]
MKEEIKRILKMVEEGRLKAEEAERLLEAILDIQKKTPSGKFLKIKIEDERGDKVNMSIPMGLIKMATKFIPKDKKEHLKEKDIDIEEILSTIKESAEGEIINIKDKDGSCIKIWIE